MYENKDTRILNDIFFGDGNILMLHLITIALTLMPIIVQPQSGDGCLIVLIIDGSKSFLHLFFV